MFLIAGGNSSKCDKQSGSTLLATYRCQETTSRLEMRFRTVEGQYGSVQLIVIAKMNPKTAQVYKVDIKPLSLHHRVNVIQEEETPRPLNHLRFTGNFTLLQVECVLPELFTAFRNRRLGFSLSRCTSGCVCVCRRSPPVCKRRMCRSCSGTHSWGPS